MGNSKAVLSLHHGLGGAFCSVFLGVAVAACAPSDESENLLPTQATNPGGSSSGESADPTGGDTGSDGATTDGATTGGTGPAAGSYRFECVDIQTLGDADESVFQVSVLEGAWNSDIDNYKLNIVFEVVSADAAAGTADVGIRSGVGTNAGDQCFQTDTQSEVLTAAFDSSAVAWSSSAAMGKCSAAAEAGAQGEGTFALEFGSEAKVYIYAEDDDGTTFNCTPDAGTPDAVPVRALQAEITLQPDGGAAGQLTGCLLESELQVLCSCLGSCTGGANAACGGCPDGSTPLNDLLSGISTSSRCTDLLGAAAYDIAMGFNASKLPGAPSSCGG